MSTSAPKTYYVLFHQAVPQGITVTEKPLLTREMGQSDTWQVTEFVSAPAAMESDITARAWILNTLQQAEATVPVSVTSTPPPPQLGTLGSWPSALHPDTTTDVRFTIAVSGSSLPASLDLEQEISGSWQVIGTLTDSGQDGDVQAGDGIYGGMVGVSLPHEGALVFRAVAPTGTSAPYALTVTSFPIGAAPTRPGRSSRSPPARGWWGTVSLSGSARYNWLHLHRPQSHRRYRGQFPRGRQGLPRGDPHRR